MKNTANGGEYYAGGAALKVSALRDDVLRVQVSPTGGFREDGSWAVLPQAKSHSVSVSPFQDANSVGFRTTLLTVRIDRKSMRMTITDKQGFVVQEDAVGRPIEYHGSAFRAYKQMPEDEHYFGLGDKVGPLDRRNQAFVLWNSDKFEYQESTDPIYKSIPFFLAVRKGRAAGVLFDNTWRTSFDFGKETSRAFSFGADNGPLDYYILYGPEPKQVLSAYAWLTGPTPLPPLWTLGFQQSRWGYASEAEVRDIAAKLRQDKIPADALYLDIDFQDQNRPFTVNTKTFPNFPRMIRDLKSLGFHTVAITDLHIARVPNAGYAPYDSGVSGDHFLKNPDGNTYVGTVWPGASVFPDFSREETREWWGSLYRNFAGNGVAGFWNDMNEPAIFEVPSKTMPDDVQHRIDDSGFEKRTASHAEMHNVYGMLNTKATYEGLRSILPNQRPFVLTRASYAGGHRYAATWTGDNSSTWNHLRMTTPMLLNLGLSGFGLSGADVGGFAGTPQPELLTRWLEVAAFQPIYRDHTAKGTGAQEPWVHGEKHEAIRRKYIEERYKLLPYIYTAAEEMSRTGVPILRPLFLEFPDSTVDGHPLDLDAGNEFLLGSSLLVAPSPFEDRLDDYPILLPPVNWYDYWTGAKIENRARAGSVNPEQAKADVSPRQKIVVHPTLDHLPVYVREGTILPMQPVIQNTVEKPTGPLTLRVYPGQNCGGSLYQDDGETMQFQKGQSLRVEFECSVTEDGVHLKLGAHQGSFPAWWSMLRVEVYGLVSKPMGSVLAKANAAKQAISGTYDQHRQSLAIDDVEDDGHGLQLDIQTK